MVRLAKAIIPTVSVKEIALKWYVVRVSSAPEAMGRRGHGPPKLMLVSYPCLHGVSSSRWSWISSPSEAIQWLGVGVGRSRPNFVFLLA